MKSFYCTRLKNALLTAKNEGGFLCLSASEIFPVALKECTNRNPSKLLIRSFYSEIRLILKKLRDDRKVLQNTGGALFFGPCGTGKSWAAMAILVDELRDAEKSGKTVVYFDAPGHRAFVFGKSRSMTIGGLTNPNIEFIPELMMRDTILIYDAVRGGMDSLACFPCELLIFASPGASDFHSAAKNSALVRFVCPNWSTKELVLLNQAFGGKSTVEEIERRFEIFGGSPRAVVANAVDLCENTQERTARLLLDGGVHLWSDLVTNLPSGRVQKAEVLFGLLKAQYDSEKPAETPDEAYMKYLERNVVWDYSSKRIKELVHMKYDQAYEDTKRKFRYWLGSEPKARALHRHWFEYEAHSLIESTEPFKSP